MIMKVKIVTIVLLVLASLPMLGKEYKEVVNKHYVFGVEPDCQLTVTNRYGDVILNRWDKDTIVIDIEMNINTTKKEKTDALKEVIDFKVVNSSYYVVASTNVGNYSGSFINNFNRLMQTMFTSSNQLDIKYTVYYPTNATIKVENKYGNVVIDDVAKNLHVKLKNGDLRVGNVGGFLEIEQDFGNAHIGNIQDAQIRYSFGDLEIKTSKNVKIQSRSGRINIAEVHVLEVESVRDKYFIGKIGHLKGNANFSYFNIFKFSQDMSMSTNFGELNINGIEKNFANIDIVSEYTDVYIQVDPSYPVAIEIEHSSNTEIVTNIDVNLKEEEGPDKKTKRSKGKIGQSKAKSSINIKASSGKITITK